MKLWLKRNLWMAVTMLAAVLLIVAGGAFVWAKYGMNAKLDLDLESTKQELRRLGDLQPSPTPENVQAARADVKRAQEYSVEARKLFAPTPYQPLTSQSYRSMLDTNLAELRRLAAQAGVGLPTNYNFSFEPQTRSMTFEPSSLKPLSVQLTEISDLCRALFAARVHRLESIRRVAVSQYDAAAGTDILTGARAVSNRMTGLYVWPYELVFECFSGELGRALEEIIKQPRMVVVKTLSVEPAAPTALAGPAFGPSTPVPATGVEPSGRFPPGRGPGGRLPPPAATRGAQAPGRPPELVTVLEEKLLRVVMLVHVVKPDR